MNFIQLRSFVALAETANFHRAAEALGVAQPQISIALRKLEDELGVRLFDRNRRHVALTDVGRALVGDARRALLHADQLRVSATEASLGKYGRLRIAFVGSATYDLLPRLLRVFRAAYPHVELHLEESRTVAILAALEKRSLDIGIVRLPVLDATQVTIEWIARDEWLAAVPASHDLSRQDQIELADLADHPFVAHSREVVPNLHTMMVMLCNQAGFQPKIAEEAIQLQTLLCLVASGLGVALVPSNIASIATPGVTFRRLKNQVSAPEIGLGLALSAEPASAAARNFRTVARGALMPAETVSVV